MIIYKVYYEDVSNETLKIEFMLGNDIYEALALFKKFNQFNVKVIKVEYIGQGVGHGEKK